MSVKSLSWPRAGLLGKFYVSVHQEQVHQEQNQNGLWFRSVVGERGVTPSTVGAVGRQVPLGLGDLGCTQRAESGRAQACGRRLCGGRLEGQTGTGAAVWVWLSRHVSVRSQAHVSAPPTSTEAAGPAVRGLITGVQTPAAGPSLLGAVLMSAGSELCAPFQMMCLKWPS